MNKFIEKAIFNTAYVCTKISLNVTDAINNGKAKAVNEIATKVAPVEDKQEVPVEVKDEVKTEKVEESNECLTPEDQFNNILSKYDFDTIKNITDEEIFFIGDLAYDMAPHCKHLMRKAIMYIFRDLRDGKHIKLGLMLAGFVTGMLLKAFLPIILSCVGVHWFMAWIVIPGVASALEGGLMYLIDRRIAKKELKGYK